MTKQEQLNILESRQLELQRIMSSSDAHAAKCTKLGKKFSTQYPDDYTAYLAANEEYNANEVLIEELKREIEEEEEERQEPGPEEPKEE